MPGLCLTEAQDETVAKLSEQLERGRTVMSNTPQWRDFDSYGVAYRQWIDDWDRWEKFTADRLRQLFRGGSLVRELLEGRDPPEKPWESTGIEQTDRLARTAMAKRLSNLRSITERVEAGLFEQCVGQTSDESSTAPLNSASINVFIVHGHDRAARAEVARFVNQVGLHSVILEEQPSAGLTVIEKFERDSAKAAAAVVLLTPDDLGKAKDAEDLKPRARQNVVFELGYLAARLGRGRVFALIRGQVEIPSDYSGVVYTAMDEHAGWKLTIARELSAAGLPVDSSKLI